MFNLPTGRQEIKYSKLIQNSKLKIRNLMVISKSNIFLLCCLSFIAGIALASFITSLLINYNFYFFILAIIFLITAISFWPNKNIRIASLVGIFLFLGIWRFNISQLQIKPDVISYYNDQKIKLTGRIVMPPDVRQDSQKLTVEAMLVNFSPDYKKQTEERKISGKVLITTNLYPVYNYGDELEIAGQIKTPADFNGFAYDKYLARYDIYSVSYFPTIKILNTRQGSWFYSKIFDFKNKLTGAVNYGLPEPLASLANAIMFGDKRGLPQEYLDYFSRTGTTHIMAISGMNITIIAALSLSLMLAIGLSRKQAFYLAVLLLIIFIILVGVPASALRAGLMGFLVLWALKIGRLNKITNSIVLAGAIMLLINPKLLRYDVGFQLSFLAILGLVYFYPLINEWLIKIKIPKLKGGREIFSMTMAAQVFTLPITASNFSTVSLIAPLPNVLILGTIPLLTALIFIAIFFTIFIPGLSIIFFAPVWVILKYIILVCTISAHIPLAYIKIDYINIFWIFLYYLFFIGFLIIRNHKSSE
jgi:competence protein ComEC